VGVAKGDHVTTGIKAYDMHACAMATSPLPAVADGSEDVACITVAHGTCR